MDCKLERNADNTAAHTLCVTRICGKVLQSKYKMDLHAKASILLPSLSSEHQLIDKIKTKTLKDLWVIVWRGVYAEDISLPQRLEHTSY